jgi:hypothetical protein
MSPGCRKNKNSMENELSKLPPITQTGQNSFGCLVNGKAWTPKGWDGNKQNLDLIIDPGYANGNFDLRTYRYINDKRERIVIFSNNLKTTGLYNISPSGVISVDFKSEILNCTFLHSSQNFSSGFLSITRYDLQAGIVSGEFECKLFDTTTSCDTIRITSGRFDYKL